MYRQIKFFWMVMRFEARRFRQYPTEMVGAIASHLIDDGLFVLFWYVVSRYGVNQSISTRDVVSYYLITSGLIPFFYVGLGVGSTLLDFIKSGQLSTMLLRPMAPWLYAWAIRTGRNSINLVVGFVMVLAGIYIGLPSYDVNFWALLPMIILNMCCINMAFNIIIGTLGFYSPEAKNIRNAIGHVLRLLQGGLIALYYLPEGVFKVLSLTPFPASSYHLTATLQGRSIEPMSVVIGCIWGIVLLLITTWWLRFSLRRYEAVGL